MNRQGKQQKKAPKALQKNTQRKLTTKRQTKSTKKVATPLVVAKRAFHPNPDQAFGSPTIHSEPNQPAEHGISGHTLRVKKLYRKLLRDHFNWYGLQYDNWLNHAESLRQEFEKNRNLTDAGEIETVIREAEVYLFQTQDPSPYRPIMHPQGGLWGRNEVPMREFLKPPPSTLVFGRDYHEEERVIRHLHADKHDVDYAPTIDAYAKMKILRGEYWFEPENPATLNPVVADYAEFAGIQFTPDADLVGPHVDVQDH
jgi:hypothetical protein